jgi:IclR family transcriptional regulator, KDG regulon repressor
MVQVILKAFDILELVAQRNGQAISLPEVSEELQLNQATTANIINTMVSRSYLEHIGKKKGYKLGPSAFRLTNEVAYEQDLVNAAKDAMEKLTSSINETCLLGILRNNKRYILHNVNCNQDIQVQIRSERNVYETASGRLLLAYLNTKEREKFIQVNGLPSKQLWEEASTLKGLDNALENIRNEKLSTTYFVGNHIIGFAVPIFMQKQVIAGLSVFLPEYRCPEQRKIQIIDALRNAALEIEQNYLRRAENL